MNTRRTTWERHLQLLLLANEFLFVDSGLRLNQ